MILINKIEIQNFRSIITQEISLNNLNIFVGQNDAGKSNLLKALNLFFNNQTDLDQEFNWGNDYCKMAPQRVKKAKEIKITIHFNLPSSYNINDVKWTKAWRAEGLVQNEKLPKKTHSKYPAFLDRIKFEYIPAVKSTDYFKSLLSKLYTVLTGKVSKMSKELNNLSTSLTNITKDLSTDIRKLLNFDSVLQMPEDLTPIFRDLVFKTNDMKDNSILLNFRGDGIKSRHIPPIIKFISHSINDNLTKGQIPYNTIWGYEEPENGLELKMSYEQADEFFEHSESMQIFITTHSPAFYSLKDKTNSNVFFALKNFDGGTTFSKQEGEDLIHDQIGLMPLVQPMIDKAKRDQDDLILKQKTELERVNAIAEDLNKIFIFTEGKTDIGYLKLAMQKLNWPLRTRIEFCGPFSGDGELLTLYNFFQKVPSKNICIFMFDRDVREKIYPIEKGANKTLRFSIPIPAHREGCGRISIEHYLTDMELKTEDGDGRRLYFWGEFLPMGFHKDDTGKICPGVSKGGTHDPIYVLSGSELQKVVDRGGKNYALSKADFVQKIENNERGFSDFSFTSFNLILDIIKNFADEVSSICCP